MPPRRGNNIERRSQRKRQTRLTFDPVDKTSSPATKSPAKVRYQVDDDESDDILTASTKKFVLTPGKVQKSRGLFKTLPTPVKSSQSVAYPLDHESENDPFQSTSKPRTTQKARLFGAGTRVVDEDSSDGSVPEEAVITPSNMKRYTGTKDKATLQSVDSDSEDEIITSSRVRGTRSSTSKPRQKPIIILEDSDDDDSEEIVAHSSTKRAPKPTITRQEIEEDDEDDEEPVTSPLKRPRMIALESDSESEVSSPAKTRRISGKSKSPVPSRVLRKPRRHRTAKEKTMELLKRKRAGENISELTETESDSDEEEAKGAYDTDSDLHALSEFEDEEESPDQENRTKSKSTRRHAVTGNEDHYDSEFVVDDDDDPLGIPDIGLHDIPLEFTHAAHKPLKEHFKDAVEWMVQNKINPGFSRNDPIYRQAFVKLNNEYETLANSKFASTQWTNEFIKAINARPIMIVRGLNLEERNRVEISPKCDACNHRKHIPSFVISFSGKAYNKDTLEEIDQDSDSDDDDENEHVDEDNERVSVDENGADIPNESKEWLTGRFCHENAYTAHMLIHWKYSLNEWVIDSLENEGQLAPAKLAARDRMKPKQRLKDANSIVDSWEANGQIQELYRDFKNQLQTARESKQGRWNAGAFKGY